VYDKYSLYFLSRSALGEDVTLRLRAYQDKFDNTLKSYDDATFTTQDRPFAFTSVYDDQTMGFGADAEWRAAEGHVLRGAVSYKNDEHVESDDIDEPREKFEDEVWSFAAEYQYAVGANTPLIGGLSYNRQEGQRADQKLPDGTIVPFETGTTDAVNGQVVLAHVLDNGLRAFGGIARKTRFPTIKDRYTSRFGSALPNPDLDPETSDNFELGVEGADAGFTWKAALFYSRLEDAIESVSIPASACSSPPCTQFQNVAEQRNQGIELSAQLAFGDAWMVSGNYTWLDRENVSDPDIRPLDTPEHSALLWVEWKPVPGLSLTASGEFNSSRNSTTDGLRVADGFSVFALKGRWLADSGIEVSAGVENIADELYAYEEGYYEPGRRYSFGLGYRF
jgi:iron complex outermembrane receptor protein